MRSVLNGKNLHPKGEESSFLEKPLFQKTLGVQESKQIPKIRLHNFDQLKTHFYILKLGFKGIHYFPYFCSKT